jgi:hypothetical protein
LNVGGYPLADSGPYPDELLVPAGIFIEDSKIPTIFNILLFQYTPSFIFSVNLPNLTFMPDGEYLRNDSGVIAI